MLIKADLKDAKWVGTGKKDYPVVISSQFNTENIKSAVITVGCFGTFRLFVNGQKVTDTNTLNKIKAEYAPGDTLKFKVYKYSTGKTENLDLTLAEQLPE